MVTQQLLDYIKTRKKQGETESAIRTSLLKNNWLERDITEAFELEKSGLPIPAIQRGIFKDWDMHTRKVIVILWLFLAYPLGLLAMWQWMKHWKTWVKIFITLPLIIGILYGVSLIPIAVPDPFNQKGAPLTPTPQAARTVSPTKSQPSLRSREFCKFFDGDVNGCDDNAKYGCAYYYCSNQCWPRGTLNSRACPSSRNQ